MKAKENNVNMYYMNQGKKSKETIDEMMQRKKSKEREKTIKLQKQQSQEDKFDFETDVQASVSCVKKGLYVRYLNQRFGTGNDLRHYGAGGLYQL